MDLVGGEEPGKSPELWRQIKKPQPNHLGCGFSFYESRVLGSNSKEEQSLRHSLSYIEQTADSLFTLPPDAVSKRNRWPVFGMSQSSF